MDFNKNNIHLSKKLIKTAKRRILSKNKTHKQIKNLVLENPLKYFTRNELLNSYKQKGHNEIIEKIKNKIVLNPGKINCDKKILDKIYELNKKCISTLSKKTIKHNKTILRKQKTQNNYIEEYTPGYILTKNLKHQYISYYLTEFCKTNNILDIDQLAKHFDYFRIKNVIFNDSINTISFCVDVIGDRNYYLIVKNLTTNNIDVIDFSEKHKNEKFISIHDTLNNKLNSRQISNDYLWIDDESIIYITYDKFYNINKCCTYNIKTKKRRIIFNEKRNRMLGLSITDNGEVFNTKNNYIILYSSSYNDDEIYIIDINEKNLYSHMKKVNLILPPVLTQKRFVSYPYINHIDACWYILKCEKGDYTFMKTMDYKKYDILFTLKNNKYKIIQKINYLLNNFIFLIQNKGNYEIKVFNLCSNKFINIDNYEKCNLCSIKNSCYFDELPMLQNTNEFIFYSSSFTRQPQIYKLNISLNSYKNPSLELIKNNDIIKNSNIVDKTYNEKTVYLRNNQIMITLIHKRTTKLKNAKCLLWGYGSYGDNFESKYNKNNILTLCDKGFVVVIAHIRGDNKMGFKQYYDGMDVRKINTFDDFIYIAENYLFKNGITNRKRLAIWGRSAGGLLISSVINMKPDVCELAIMGVPFVTPLLTLGSSENPLGFESHSEWGDPRNKKVHDYIKSYSPIDNIKPCAKYPNIFIYANLNDTLTPYKETLMYHDKMKEVEVFKNNERDMIIYLNDKFGHNQGSSLKDVNYTFSLIFSALDKYIK